uniref:Anoctamin dimerisation domain-containing protein n=1 Tax=Myripristis murdjan TaxID=586833 RepID=A0A667X576_9TELE
GPYFDDGQRRVDYVLAYNIQKPGSVRRQSSRFSDNTIIRRLRRSLNLRGSRAPLQPKEDPEIAAQEQRTDYREDDKRFRREEFEENLLEMGLELEKDEGSKIPGIGFLKIHAPWKVLCREAEFMKLKMPTKKVYEVKQGSNTKHNPVNTADFCSICLFIVLCICCNLISFLSFPKHLQKLRRTVVILF